MSHMSANDIKSSDCHQQVHESPISPASSCLSQNHNDNDQVLLATMQPVSVIDLHESDHTLHHKYNNHHATRHQSNHHDDDHIQRDDDANGRVSPEGNPTNLGHKMIDLIYNDGQKTVMYTHDKEIIYESEADRVQVVEYPPPPPSPSPPPTPQGRNSMIGNGRHQTPTTLHLHHYPQLQLQHDDDLPRGVGGVGAGSANTTTTVLVLSELVAADPSSGATGLGLGSATPSLIRSG